MRQSKYGALQLKCTVGDPHYLQPVPVANLLQIEHKIHTLIQWKLLQGR